MQQPALQTDDLAQIRIRAQAKLRRNPIASPPATGKGVSEFTRIKSVNGNPVIFQFGPAAIPIAAGKLAVP
jgi:hypothetical protein